MSGGYMFVADTNNHVIRRVDLESLVVDTVEIVGLG